MNDIGKRLMNDLQRELNITPAAAAGIVGNLAHESGNFQTLQEIKPMVEGSRGGYGYAQWTGPRRKAFESWSKEQGLDPSSYEANKGFLVHELTQTPESKVLKSLGSVQTPEEAAQIFSNEFLRPGIPRMESRVKLAGQYGQNTVMGDQGQDDLSRYEIVDDAAQAPKDLSYWAQAQEAMPKLGGAIGRGRAFWEGGKQGTTWGTSDEIQAAMAASVAASQDPSRSWDDYYNQALEEGRNQLALSREQYPMTTLAGEVLGGVLTGGALAKRMGIVGGAGSALQQGTRGALTGAASGGIYGFGTGEDGAGERLGNAALVGTFAGLLGGAGGAVSGAVGNTVSNFANRVLNLKRAKQLRATPQMTGEAQMVSREAVQPSASNKVLEALRRDYPDDAMFQDAVQKLQSGEMSLIDMGGPNVKNLMESAAQFPQGRSAAQKFFEGVPEEVGGAPTGGAVEAARTKVTQSLEEAISQNKDFLGTLDDVVSKGREKAAPLYEKAYEGLIEPTPLMQSPEIMSAIKSAKRKYPTELQGFPDNSVKVLDFAKRELDDVIGKAQRAGEGNLARSRTELKNQLLTQIDEQVPDYAKARAVSGDYLSIKNAMEEGASFNRSNADEIAKYYKGLNEPEKEAYKNGMIDFLRREIDKASDAGNVQNRIFGSAEKRAKLKAVLSDDEFFKLRKDMAAADKIYEWRNKALGGSPSAPRLIGAADLSSEGKEALREIADGNLVKGGAKAMFGGVKKIFDDLDDKQARDIVRIITAQGEAGKLRVIQQITDASNPSEAAKKLGGKTGVTLSKYFQLEKMLKDYGAGGLAGNAAVLGSQPTARQEPLRITVTPNEPKPVDYDRYEVIE